MAVTREAKSTGMRIKLHRTAAGLSQPQLAYRMEQVAGRRTTPTPR